MGRVLVLVVVALAALVFGSWHFRDRLLPAPLAGPKAAPAATPVRAPDVLYTWVDKDGVTHFEQASGKGTRVVYDGSRITPLPPVEVSPAGQGSRVAESVGTSVHKLRKELEAGGRQMREAKAAVSPDL